MLRVTDLLKKWPERKERKLAWLPVADALKLIQEPGIVPLLHRLAELEDELLKPASGKDKAPPADGPKNSAD